MFEDKIIINIPDQSKLWENPFFNQGFESFFSKKIFHASTQSEYILRTKLIREPGSILFVSCENPHKSVAPRTLSKVGLKINVSCWSGHKPIYRSFNKARCNFNSERC